MSMNLRPFQWQIGGLVFGKYTQYKVFGPDIDSYNVANQDFQIANSDQTRMRKDALQAQNLTFTIGVIDNAPMPYMANTLPDDLVTKSSKLLEALQTEWKATDIRFQWGQLKPLSYCDGYGRQKRIYGRPRKFKYTGKSEHSQYHKVQAEYARSDTLSYSEDELVADLVEGAGPVDFTRTAGNALSPYRVLFTGPMVNPFVVVGDDEIQLQTTILADVLVEVSSYPWQQRVVDSEGFNRRTALIGNTKRLDQLGMPPATPIAMSWTASSTTGDSECQVIWRDAYDVL